MTDLDGLPTGHGAPPAAPAPPSRSPDRRVGRSTTSSWSRLTWTAPSRPSRPASAFRCCAPATPTRLARADAPGLLPPGRGRARGGRRCRAGPARRAGPLLRHRDHRGGPRRRGRPRRRADRDRRSRPCSPDAAIATFRKEAGLGLPVALMSPAPGRIAPDRRGRSGPSGRGSPTVVVPLLPRASSAWPSTQAARSEHQRQVGPGLERGRGRRGAARPCGHAVDRPAHGRAQHGHGDLLRLGPAGLQVVGGELARGDAELDRLQQGIEAQVLPMARGWVGPT